MTDNDFEKQLSAGLGNRSIAPSDEAWRRIAHNRQQGRVVVKKHSFLKYAAVLILIPALLTLWFMLPDKNTGTTPQVATPAKAGKAIMPPFKENESIKITPAYKGELATLNGAAVPYDTLAVRKEITTVVAPAAPTFEMEANNILNVEVLSQNIQYKNEADDLLANAMKQVEASKVLTTKTNDTALLKEVQAEMDQYYRDKAMKIFSLEHKTIRIAVRDKQ